MQRKNWRLEEDNALLQNCQQLNFNWKKVSKNMNQLGFKRSGKSCKERFQNQLNPQINKDQWSQNEIDKLFELQIKYGNKWRIIAKELPNRTDSLIKNYFYSFVRKVLRRLSKAVGRNKNSSKMTKTLKPSIISSIFCANETKQSTISLEFAQIFRNIIFKYKNYNLSQQIDNDDIGKIKLIFITLQKLNESYNFDITKRLKSKIDLKQEKSNRKNFNVNFNKIILHKINNKLPIFTTNLYPLEKLYTKSINYFDSLQQNNTQAKSSQTSLNIIPLKQQQQYAFYYPFQQYFYSMTLNAYIQQQQNLSNLYNSYQNESIKIKQEIEE